MLFLQKKTENKINIMETIKLTTKQYLKTLTIINFALIIGQVLFGVIVIYLTLNGFDGAKDSTFENVFTYLLPIVTFGGLIASIFVYKKKISLINYNKDLYSVLTEYRSALITRYALLEAPSFLALVVTLLTGNFMFLIYAGLMILCTIYWRPTKNSILKDLELSQKHITILDDPDAILN